MLKRLKKADRTLTETAQDHLEAFIIESGFKPGHKLPSQEEMGRRLNVSRTVVREAVRLLTAKGLVEAQNGAGIFVRAPGMDQVTKPMSRLMQSRAVTIDQLMEARETLEVTIAGLAAERAEPADIRALENTVEILRTADIDTEEFVQADLAFHRHMAAAARNPLYELMLSSVHEVLGGFIAASAKRYGAASRDHAVADHDRILRRVRTGDAEGARREAKAELAKARKMLRLPNERRQRKEHR